jgi:uncharacterized membrane protein YccC
MLSLPEWARKRAPFFWLGVRTALAVVLAIGVALSMDWQRPQWAGIAVISISQDSEAATLGKGRLRLAATLGAALCAITLIALFPQDRWGFFMALSLYVGLCGYHMLASRHGYAWRVAAYVCPVIAISAGSIDAVNDFATALERFLENLTGVASIVLIALLAGTRGNRQVFERYIRDLAGKLADLIGRVVAMVRAEARGQPSPPETLADLRAALGRFEVLLLPAIDESSRIARQRGGWRSVQQRFGELLDSLAGWRLTLLRLGPHGTTTSLNAHLAEALTLQHRLERMAGATVGAGDGVAEGAKGGDFEAFTPMESLALRPAAPSAGDRAALSLALQQLRRVEQSTTALEHLLGSLAQDPRDQAAIPSPAPGPWTLDPDRLKVAIRMALGIWIAALLWMFVPDLPGGVGLITLTAVFSAVLALAGMRAQQLLPAVLIALLPAGVVYVSVLPKLEGYAQLALLLILYIVTVFVVTGEQRALRTLAIDFMLITFGITNQQTFNFIGFLDRTVAIVIACGIIAVLQEIPWSSMPERQYLEALARLRRTVAAMHGLLLAPVQAHHRLRRMVWQQRLLFLKEELRRLPASMDQISRSSKFSRFGLSAQTIATVNQAAWSASLLLLELQRLSGRPEAHQLAVEAVRALAGTLDQLKLDDGERGWERLCSLLALIEQNAMEAYPALAAVARGLTESMQQLTDFQQSVRNRTVTITPMIPAQ